MGHSLGAALAVLCAYHLQPLGFPSVVYVCGCPRVGNIEFATECQQRVPVLWNITNLDDIITSLPLAVMPNFRNPDKPWMFQVVGTPVTFSTNWGSVTNNHLLPIYLSFLSQQSQSSQSQGMEGEAEAEPEPEPEAEAEAEALWGMPYSGTKTNPSSRVQSSSW